METPKVSSILIMADLLFPAVNQVEHLGVVSTEGSWAA